MAPRKRKRENEGLEQNVYTNTSKGNRVKPKPQKREGPGKPPLSDSEKTVLIRAKVTESQRDKFLTLGGSEWLRNLIDKAK